MTEEEKKTFTAKSMRKAFSNWGRMHPEAAVVKATLETQDHSKRVDELFYKVASGSRVAYANQRIMDDVMDSTTATDNVAVVDDVAEQSSGSESSGSESSENEWNEDEPPKKKQK